MKQVAAHLRLTAMVGWALDRLLVREQDQQSTRTSYHQTLEEVYKAVREGLR